MRVTAIALAAMLGLVLMTPISAQQLMALRAEWSDLQTWSTDIGNTRERELGLGLQLSGSSGGTLLAFIARIDTRRPNVAPGEIVAQAAVGRLTNPNVVRRPILTFVINQGGDGMSNLDLSGRLRVDDASPGGSFENGIAVFPAADFARLASADTISADVFGFDAELRADQIEAMKDFADRLHLSPGR